jgi:hypothetical protein
MGKGDENPSKNRDALSLVPTGKGDGVVFNVCPALLVGRRNDG